MTALFPQPSQSWSAQALPISRLSPSRGGRLHSAFRVPRNGRGVSRELLTLTGLIVEIMNLLYRKAPRALVVFRRKKAPKLPLHHCVIIENGSSLIIMHDAQSYYLQHFDCALSSLFIAKALRNNLRTIIVVDVC